jgi:hypothetical protein
MQVLSSFQDIVSLTHQEVRVFGKNQLPIRLSGDPFQYKLRWRLEELQVAVIDSRECFALFTPHLFESFILPFDVFVANAYEKLELQSLFWSEAKEFANTSPIVVSHCVFDNLNLHGWVQIPPFGVRDLKRRLTSDLFNFTDIAGVMIYLPHQGAPESRLEVTRRHYSER